MQKKSFNKRVIKRSNPFRRTINLDSETCRIFDSFKNRSETIRLMINARKHPDNPEQLIQSLRSEIRALQQQWDKETAKVNDFYQGQIYMRQKRIENIVDIIERQRMEKKLTEFAVEIEEDGHN